MAIPPATDIVFLRRGSMIVHPSMLIRVDLDERQYNKEIAADVTRAYDHIAHALVRSHAATEPACNVMALKVTSSRAYWADTDDRQAQMWPVVRDWLHAKAYFVGENIKAFNKTRGQAGGQTIDYGELRLETDPYTFAFALNEASDLPAFDELCDRFHTCLNAGAFEGVDVALVRMPGRDALETQRTAKAGHEQEACGDAEWGPADQPAPAEGETSANGVAISEGAAVGAQTSEAASPTAIDYSVWDIVSPDGSARAFDSEKGQWV